MKRLYNIVYKLSKAVGKLDKKSRGNKYEFVYVEKGAQHVEAARGQVPGRYMRLDTFAINILIYQR